MDRILKFGALIMLLSMFLFVACGDDDEELCDDGTTAPCDVAETADTTIYVSIGNSLTAGFISAALLEDGQENSYPNLIHTQIALIDTTFGFTQPLVSYPGLPEGLLEWTGFDTSGNPIIEASTGTGTPINTDATKFRNVAVPGAYLGDVLSATGAANSWLTQFGLPGNALFDLIVQGQTQFQRAKAQSPTLVTLWIGNNDILGYAASGGLLPPTSTDGFASLYATLADSIATLGAKVVVANIPDVTAAAYFTTIGPSIAAQSLPQLYYMDGDSVSQPVDLDNDFLLLTLPTDFLGDTTGIFGPAGVPFGFHPSNPLWRQFVLDSADAAIAAGITAAYNATISSAATANGWELFDVNAVLNSAISGITRQGEEFTAAYITGKLFSLDGIHPTGRGQGVIANEFIAAINTATGKSYSEVTLSGLPVNGVKGTAKIAAGALDGMLRTFGFDPVRDK